MTTTMHAWPLTRLEPTPRQRRLLTENLSAEVAANIRAEMARARVTQRDLARVLGTNQQWLSRRMCGEVDFRIGELVVIAELIGVPTTTLLPRREDSDTPARVVTLPHRDSNTEPAGYRIVSARIVA